MKTQPSGQLRKAASTPARSACYAISNSEHQQNHLQDNMASRQRADEYNRARLATAHIDNANDFISEARRATYQLRYFSF
jgi:hypothetical protein